jgi:hypothetical protein
MAKPVLTEAGRAFMEVWDTVSPFEPRHHNEIDIDLTLAEMENHDVEANRRGPQIVRKLAPLAPLASMTVLSQCGKDKERQVTCPCIPPAVLLHHRLTPHTMRDDAWRCRNRIG